MELFKSCPNWTFLLLWFQASGGESFLIKNARLGKCIHVFPHAVDQVGLSECKPHSLHHQWGWDMARRAVVSLATKQCLSVSHLEEFALAQVGVCGGEGPPQGWTCSQKGHLTLQGSGLHLTTKPGGHKAFLAKEKDKFSRWKTLTDEIICAVEPAVTDLGFGDPVEERLDPLDWVPESKSTASLELRMTFPVKATTVPPATIWEDLSNTTSTFPKNEDGGFAEDQERYTHHKKHPKKATGSRHPGTNWKIIMLVLSPVAFILGLVILLLNIHYNRPSLAACGSLARLEETGGGGGRRKPVAQIARGGTRLRVRGRIARMQLPSITSGRQMRRSGRCSQLGSFASSPDGTSKPRSKARDSLDSYDTEVGREGNSNKALKDTHCSQKKKRKEKGNLEH
nr:uncharacterized protein LOC132765352 [Anolis sagrei ordinatus]